MLRSDRINLTVDGLEVFLGFIVQLLGLLLELLKSAFGIGIDRILSVLADIELQFQLLRGT